METTLPVSFDKSHITAIGEKMYGESLELVRELVSNAYDADATMVWIDVETQTMRVRDNGIGMDLAGLREYFNIGSQNKILSNTTPIYGRSKIGQFGIGKFAVLSACSRFRLHTQKDGYAAEVVFDEEDWRRSKTWTIPIRELAYDETLGNGTIIILERLKKHFSLPEIERFVRERLPLSAPHFAIYLNKKKIDLVAIPGQRFIVHLPTEFGAVKGEIIAPNFRHMRAQSAAGIEITVNNVVIKKETFGMESQPLFTLYKITGRVRADFLPITSDRSRFITDCPHYRSFFEGMKKEMRKIFHVLNESADLKAKQKADLTLKDAMSRLSRAIRKNPAFSPQIMTASGEIDPSSEHTNSLAPAADKTGQGDIEAFRLELLKEGHDVPKESFLQSAEVVPTDSSEKAKKVKIKNLAGKMLVARRIKIGGLGIVCNIDRFGKDEKPVFTEGGVIYVNQDHPLYQKQARLGNDHLGFYLAYLLSQQIALLVGEIDSHRAFEIQSKLLSDCF